MVEVEDEEKGVRVTAEEGRVVVVETVDCFMFLFGPATKMNDTKMLRTRNIEERAVVPPGPLGAAEKIIMTLCSTANISFGIIKI